MLENFQQEYVIQCNYVYELMTDMDVHEADVRQLINTALSMRSRLALVPSAPAQQRMLANAPAQQMEKKPRSGSGKSLQQILEQYSLSETDASDAKQILGIVIQKEKKVSSIKEMVDFTPEEMEGGFRVIVSGPGLQSAYEGIAETKKEAENFASYEALLAEYPEIVAQCQSQTPSVKAHSQRQDVEQAKQEPKGRLCHFIQCLLDRTLEKNDIVYTTEAADGINFFSTVTIPACEHYVDETYASGPFTSKQEAEKAVAQQAVDALKDIAQPFVEAKAERKRIKDQEIAEERKRRRLEEGLMTGT